MQRNVEKPLIFTSIKKLIKTAKKQAIPPHSEINLSAHKISRDDLKQLAHFITSPACPPHFTAHLQGNKDHRLKDNDLKYLVEVLSKNPSHEHLTLNLGHNEFNDHGVIQLALMVMRGKIKTGFKLDLSYNTGRIMLGSAEMLNKLIHHKHCPDHLTLGLNGINFNALETEILLDNLGKKNAHSYLTLDLSHNDLNMHCFDTLMTTLANNDYPDHLTLILNGNWSKKKYISRKAHQHIVNELLHLIKTKNHANHLAIELHEYPLTKGDIKQLANLMLSNLSISDIEVDMVNHGQNKDTKTIQLCCKRNQFIDKYPEFKHHILKHCQRHGLYKHDLTTASFSPVRHKLFAERTHLCKKIPNEVQRFLSEIDSHPTVALTTRI